MSAFSELTIEPQTEILIRLDDYPSDTFKMKQNLVGGSEIQTIGVRWNFKSDSFSAYKDENNKPWVLPVVRRAEQMIVNNLTLDKEYLDTIGLEEFNIAATKLLLGADSPAIRENRVYKSIFIEIQKFNFLITLREPLKIFK